MVLVNFATKEIVAKLVYYGPALCGKTTNLQYIFTRLNPKKRGKMISLATESDRTLFFDFLPLEFGMVQGFKIRFQLYTVPGQVFYGATRKLVLKGADAIIFVADSQEDVMDRNIESIEDMKKNLVDNGLDPDTIPLIMQYNKRDLPRISSFEELEEKVNYRNVPAFEASAVEGFGVMEAFKESTKLLLQELKRKHSFIDIDSVRDLPNDVFEQKVEEPEEMLDAEIEYELELGSSVDGADDDVVAGELLEQIETISFTDTCQAEAFLDDYHKGVPTEEAKQKAVKVNAGQRGSNISPAMNEELFTAAWELQEDAGVRTGRGGGVTPDFAPVDLSPIELSPDAGDFDITRDSTTMDDMPPPSPDTFSGPIIDNPLEDNFLGMDMSAPDMMEPEGAVEPLPPPTGDLYQGLELEPEPEPEPEYVNPPGNDPFRDLYQKLDTPTQAEKEKPAPTRHAPVAGAPPASRPDDMAAMQPAVDLSGLTASLEGIMSAVLKLDRRVTDIGHEVSGLKASIARHGRAADAPPIDAVTAQVSANLPARIDELDLAIKEMADGQDRLLLSILEAVRESKKSNSDSHDKIEDAVKYLIGKFMGEDKGPGKKKWF